MALREKRALSPHAGNYFLLLLTYLQLFCSINLLRSPIHLYTSPIPYDAVGLYHFNTFPAI